MNTNWQTILRLAMSILLTLFLCQCQTADDPDVVTSMNAPSKFGKLAKRRAVGHKREGGYQFSDEYRNEKAGEGTGGMLERIQNRGQKPVRDDDGNVVRWEDAGDLYEDRSSLALRDADKSFDRKEAKFGSSSKLRKEFKTPEYLKRQEFAASEFRDGNRSAHEDGAINSKLSRLFKTDSENSDGNRSRDSGRKNLFGDRSFHTENDHRATDAQDSAARPVGVNRKGYQDNVRLSMDDVKKMVNPESYRPNG